MTYYFRNQESAAAFLLGMLLFALPAAMIAEYFQWNIGTSSIFFIGAMGGVVLLLLDKLMTRVFRKRRFHKVSVLYKKAGLDARRKASEDFPYLTLPKDSPLYKRNSELNRAGIVLLQSAAGDELKKKYKFSDKDWDEFLILEQHGAN